MLKPWKCKVPQIIRCFIKPFLKNGTQTTFQEGIPWVIEILNNVIVWMVPYCAQNFWADCFLDLKKIKRKINWKQIHMNLE